MVKKSKKKAKKTIKKIPGQEVLPPKVEEEKIKKIKIRVIGIGGGGGSIVSEISKNLAFSKKGIDFVVANTDRQALKKLAKGVKRFLFGQDQTRGLGSGMNTKLGELAARKEIERIKKVSNGVDLCILVASLGGGVGSGAGPVFAEVSRQLKNITFGIFTLPFRFEGKKKARIANLTLEKLKPNLNTLAIIPNEKIFQIIDKKTFLREALSQINKILAESLAGLIEIIDRPGLINIDWADLKTILEGKERLAYLVTAQADGQNRAEEALKKVLKNPLYPYSIQGSSFLTERILFNITGNRDLRMVEVEEISKTIADFNKKAKIIFGISCFPKFKNKIKITLLATGREKKIRQRKKFTLRRRPQKTRLKIKPQTKVKPTKKSTPQPQPKTSTLKKLKKPGVPLKKIDIQPKSKKTIPTPLERPIILPEVKIRRSALQIKKAAKEVEEELLKQERVWEVPAFLRRKRNK